MNHTYVSDPMAGDLCPKHLFVSDLCFRPYGWRPMSQTPMTGDLCLRPLWLETHVSDNHTLIELLISYALYVVPSYAAFPIQ